MKVQVLGTGYAVPERVLSNAELESMVDTSDEWIVSRTGIRERRIAGKGVVTSDLALRAAEEALARSGISGADLDLIIVATVTPDMMFPSTACILQGKLGATNAAAFDLSAGCTGFLYAMVVAERFLLAGGVNHALVIGAEILSNITDFTDRNTCILFGDGAGAMVLGRGPGPNGILSTYLGADGNGGGLLHMPAGGSWMPASVETVANRLHYIRMQGNEVFKFAVKVIPDCVSRVLSQAGIGIEEVDHLVLHQANLRIMQTAAKRLNVPWDKVLVNIERYGNISAASIPVAVAEAVDEDKIKSGELVLMVGFGAGLTMGAALVRWGR
ncbi:MAG: ketoacyl-ACP synthase III [Syntrophomonadaceae bacterium]|nr:ketoacyl-ACP synthase III [Syntrophomonadaceae bacterium]